MVVAVERLVVLPCSHKRLLVRKILVERKQLCQLSMALVQLAWELDFEGEHSALQQEQKLELRNQ